MVPDLRNDERGVRGSMSWSKKSSGIIDATCDRCGNGIIGPKEFLKDQGWVVLDGEEPSACCGVCIDEMAEEGADCPECESEMNVDTLIHMSKAGPRGIRCFVCGCGEKMPVGGMVDV